MYLMSLLHSLDISSCINFLSFLSVPISLYVQCFFPQQNVDNTAILNLEKGLCVKSCREYFAFDLETLQQALKPVY